MLPLCLSTSLLFPVLIIAAPSAWVFRRLGLGAWFGSYARRHAILVASQDSAMLLTICGMSCIGFLSHSGSLTGSRPWSGADVVSVYLQEHHPQHPAPWFSQSHSSR